MHDVLFRVPVLNLEIHAYGVMAMLGFLAGLLLARWRARKVGIDPDLITDVSIWALIAGIVGSRIAYILTYPGEFRTLVDYIAIWQGGLVFYGGFIGAMVVVLLFLRLRRQPLLPVLDALAPSLALGHAFGRIGCLMRGCCYGEPVHSGAWYGIVYPDHSIPYDPHNLPAIAPGTPLFPSQPLESLNLLIIFGILMFCFTRRKAVGEVTALYLMLYAVQRFINEFLRGDNPTRLGLTDAQWIGLCAFFAGLILFLYARGRRSAAPGTRPAAEPARR